jgi:diketogulonate reductase-like aldo/keto reductase
MDVIANGARIPALGFGTYNMKADDIARMIPVALRAGFRHIDTAENAAIFDFELDGAEMSAIGELSRPDGRIVNPPGLAPDWDPA